MLSNTLDKISFWALFLVVVLLPVFFLPFTKVPIETSKGFLLVVGLTISFIAWLSARLSERKIVFPKSSLLLSGLGVILVFLLSSMFSKVPEVSFFGTLFDTGTFWFIFACFLLMFTASVVLKDSQKANMVLWGTIISFSVVLIFQILRIAFPTYLSLGVLSTKTDNILGSWNTLGLFAGFVSILNLFIIEFFTINKRLKWFLFGLLVLSVFLIAAVGFSFIWGIVGIFALLIFIYKVSFHSGFQQGASGNTPFPTISLVVIMVSLLFFVSGQFIGGYLPNQLKTLNTEITPSLSATMTIAKSVIIEHPVLGVGPNKFGEVWALYKPASINTGQFWNVYFQSGFGLIPTFASTTGVLGILSFLIFFIFLIRAGVKSIFSNSNTQSNFELAIFFMAALYLFVASFVYATGVVILLLAFAFTGIFIGLRSSQNKREVVVSFANNPKKSFFFIFLLVFLIVASAGFGFKYLERFASVPYFGRALAAENIPDAEAAIKKALALNNNDLYMRTYAQVYLIKFNSLASKNSTLSDAEKTDLRASFNEAVAGAQGAVDFNTANYLNFQSLGYVYGTAGLLGVEGAYDKAVEAYTLAANLNPLNPELRLSIARVFLAQNKIPQAKDYANQSLNLKPDYADGFLLLSQIAKSEGNNTEAIFYAKRAQNFAPDNKELSDYINSLQKPTTSPATSNDTKTTKKSTQ